MTKLNIFTIVPIVIVVALLSAVFTGIARRYSLKNKIIDIPNERSSHEIATPRGGGVSLACITICSILLGYIFDLLAQDDFLALFFSLTAVASIGWLDDKGDISSYWRFIIYSIAALWSLCWVGVLENIRLGDLIIDISFSFSIIITWLGIVWLTNLYNFMDGTDGLAAMQAILASSLGFILLLLQKEQGYALICLCLASASAGFIYWNWPTAKIFMGDIGSCMIGAFFAIFSIITDKSDIMPVSLWCMLLSLFICDATFTLIKRIIFGEKWYQAHKIHAYQLLVQMGMSHKTLLLNFILINLVIIWPATFFAWLYPHLAVYLVFTLVCILFFLWLLIQLKYRAFMGKHIGN